MVGIYDAKLSKKLQLDAKLTLDKAVTQVCQVKTVKQQQALLREGGQELSHVPIGAVQKKFCDEILSLQQVKMQNLSHSTHSPVVAKFVLDV